MQSPFEKNEEFRYSIEHCLGFDHPDGDIYTLMLSGWCYSLENPDPIVLHVSVDQEKIAQVTPDRKRQDLVGLYEGAPLECGFHLYLPIHKRLNTGETVDLEIAAGSRTVKVRQQATHLQDYVVEYMESRKMTGIKRKKLENLLLNETERIHHVKGVQSTPLYLKLDSSWACNLDCPYCHSNVLRKNRFALRDMGEKTFQNIMDRFGEKLIEVHLGCWGEPFLYSGTFDYIRAMKEFGIYVKADSHLSLEFTEEDIEALVSSGLDLLVASVDGATQATYQRYRKNGSLDLVLENLSKIMNKKKEMGRDTPRIIWQFLEFDWNENEVEPARERAQALGCDEFVVKKGETFKPYTPSTEYRDNSFMNAMTSEIQEKMTSRCEQQQQRNEYFGCDLLYHQLVIHSDGAIHPCTYFPEPHLLYGTVRLRKDVFNTAHYKNARRLFIKPPPKECQGYNPCLNCSLVLDEDHIGYVASDMDFFSAFKRITGEAFDV